MIKRFKELSKGRKIAVGVVVGVVLCALGTPVEEAENTPTTKTEAVESVETVEVKEDKKEAKKDEVKVAPEISTKYLKSVLGEHFDTLNVKYEYDIIDITMDVTDNLTTDMMLTSNGQNIRDILKALKDTGLVKADDTVKISFIGDTKDNLGNTSKGSWILVSYDGDTINKANFDNLVTPDMYKIANSTGMLPNIREELKEKGDYAFLK